MLAFGPPSTFVWKDRVISRHHKASEKALNPALPLPQPLPFMPGGRTFCFGGAANLPQRSIQWLNTAKHGDMTSWQLFRDLSGAQLIKLTSIRIAASATAATLCSASPFFTFTFSSRSNSLEYVQVCPSTKYSIPFPWPGVILSYYHIIHISHTSHTLWWAICCTQSEPQMWLASPSLTNKDFAAPWVGQTA